MFDEKLRLAFAVTIGLFVAACGASDPDGSAAPDAGAVAPTSDVAADLRFLREEEKLARDVYRKLYDRWTLAPHQNIAASEQTHTTRVRDLIVSFGLEDPVTDDAVGAFVNADLASLYAKLVAAGSESEQASLVVGATIEDLDIHDIERLKTHTTDANILATYGSLECGSRNHLRSFVSQLQSRSASYSAQYISQAELDAIVSSPKEQCP